LTGRSTLNYRTRGAVTTAVDGEGKKKRDS